MNADPDKPVPADFWSGACEGADHVTASREPPDLVQAIAPSRRPGARELEQRHGSWLWPLRDHEPDRSCTLQSDHGAALKSCLQHLPKVPADDPPLFGVLCHRRCGTTAHRTLQRLQWLVARWRALGADELHPRGATPLIESEPSVRSSTCSPPMWVWRRQDSCAGIETWTSSVQMSSMRTS